MLRKIFLVILASIFIFLIAGCQKAQETSIKNGEVYIQAKDDIVNLDGYWNFYRNHLLSPPDLHSEKNFLKENMKVPGYWQNHTGYGTYQLIVHFSESEIGQTKAVYLPQVFSAYHLWINNDLVLENGQVAKTKNEMIPKGILEVVYFTVPEQDVKLLLQVSNFYYHHTGIMGSVYLGTPSKIEEMRERFTFLESFSIGALLIIGVDHLTIFLNRRKDRLPLYFGLFCLLMVLEYY